MSEFSKNHSATASQRASSSSQYGGQHGDPKHQLHRRGYDMSNSDYYGGTMMSILTAFFDTVSLI